MFYVKVRGHFSAAHNLRNYQGSCENLHGHNWMVEVVFKGKHLDDDTGMLYDFRQARSIMNEILSRLDHRYLNELDNFKELNPTSECIARFIYKEVQKRLKTSGEIRIAVHSVTIWENTYSAATYEEDEE